MTILIAVVLPRCQHVFLFITPHLCQGTLHFLRAGLEVGLDVFQFFFQQNLLSENFFCSRQISLTNVDLDLPLLFLAVVLPASVTRAVIDKASFGKGFQFLNQLILTLDHFQNIHHYHLQPI